MGDDTVDKEPGPRMTPGAWSPENLSDAARRAAGAGRRTYFAGRTWTCMKLSRALIERISMIVPVFGFITLPCGLVGS